MRASLALTACLLAAMAPAAFALDAADIVKALKPEPLVRSLTVEGDTRANTPRTIDLQIQFEYDSSNLTNDGRISLEALGKALASPELTGLRFRIVGHTDAKGSDAYNLDLSRRRAETVRAHLAQFHGIDGARLATEGKGESELADPTLPEDGINRRVQIVTIGS